MVANKGYKCDECPRRTTEPFLISGRMLCPVCAEEFSPNVVASRKRYNYERYMRNRYVDTGFGRQRREPER